MANKCNTQIKNDMITVISKHGYKPDRYGNYKKTTSDGTYRFKFNKMSYRREKLIATVPKSWIRLSGGYYKDVKILDNNSEG